MQRAVIGMATAVLVLVPAAAGTSAAGTSAPSRQLPPALADRDGDRISDELGVLLSQAIASDRLDVIVQVAHGTDRGVLRGDHQLGRPSHDYRLIDAFAVTAPAARIRSLARDPRVVRIQADSVVQVEMEDAQVDFGTDRARRGFGLDGAGVEICVVDTGVDPTHEQLDSKAPIPFTDLVNGQTSAYDDHMHGTHVASIAAGDGVGGPDASRYVGVAPGASVSAAKVLSADGTGTESDIVAGVEWCATRGADVISMSLGTTVASDGQDAISLAVNAAVDGGAVAVVAAGNSGSDPQTIGSPGAAERAITVGAVLNRSGPASSAVPSWYGKALHNGQLLAPFSSRGPTLATDGTAATRRVKPDIAAPGVRITAADANTGDGYVGASGTSMATPFVSGTVALALQANPGLTPDDVAYLLYRTSHDRGPVGQDNDWGHGILDGWAFVAAAAGEVAASPTAFPHANVVGSVGSGSSVWTHTFEVPTLDVPVAATILIDRQLELVCYYGGLFCLEDWVLPDLDAYLIDPDGFIVDVSQCPLDCDGVTYGVQELLTAVPTKTGTWSIEVFPFDGGDGGSFVVDLSAGPVDGGDINHPTDDSGRGEASEPAVHIGDLDASVVGRGHRREAIIAIEVHDRYEVGAPGVSVTGHWSGGAKVSCTTGADGTCAVDGPTARGPLTFTIDGVLGAPFDPAAAHDPDGDSDGVSIQLP